MPQADTDEVQIDFIHGMEHTGHPDSAVVGGVARLLPEYMSYIHHQLQEGISPERVRQKLVLKVAEDLGIDIPDKRNQPTVEGYIADTIDTKGPQWARDVMAVGVRELGRVNLTIKAKLRLDVSESS